MFANYHQNSKQQNLIPHKHFQLYGNHHNIFDGNHTFIQCQVTKELHSFLPVLLTLAY